MDVTPAEQFRHLALFYRGRSEYLTVLGDFIRASRDRGDAVFVAVPEQQAEQLRRNLGDESAQVALVDMTELGRNPARIIPEALSYARGHRGQHFCCVAEPVWPGRAAAEAREVARHEALVNLAFRDIPATFLCPYDSTQLPGWIMADAGSTHPSVAMGPQEVASTGYLRAPGLPPGCDQALPRPPARAEVLSYRDDLSSVREFVASRAQRAGLPPPRVSDLVLAVSELTANTLRHTDSGGTVRVWQTGNEIICQVADHGEITDPLARHRAPPHEVMGGKGLWLVNQVCDLVQARTGPEGTTARLHMRLPQAEGDDARHGDVSLGQLT